MKIVRTKILTPLALSLAIAVMPCDNVQALSPTEPETPTLSDTPIDEVVVDFFAHGIQRIIVAARPLTPADVASCEQKMIADIRSMIKMVGELRLQTLKTEPVDAAISEENEHALTFALKILNQETPNPLTVREAIRAKRFVKSISSVSEYGACIRPAQDSLSNALQEMPTLTFRSR